MKNDSVENSNPCDPSPVHPETHQKEECISAPRESSNTSDIRCGVSNVVYRNE